MTNLAPTKTRQMNLHVPAKMYEGIEKLGKQAGGIAPSTYARMLLDAAYSARCKPTGDKDLDITVGRVALLCGAKSFNTAEIAAHAGISEATVVRIIDAWRQEIGGRC